MQLIKPNTFLLGVPTFEKIGLIFVYLTEIQNISLSILYSN